MVTQPEPGQELSPFEAVTRAFPHCRRTVYSKRTLVGLSVGMEDQALSFARSPLVFSAFQEGRFLAAARRRYRALARQAALVAVFAQGASTALGGDGSGLVPVDLEPGDPLANEWHVVIAASDFMTLLLCRELRGAPESGADDERRFEGVWTFEPEVVAYAARLFLDRLSVVHPDRTFPALPTGGAAAAALPFVQPLTTRLLAELQRTVDEERELRRAVEDAYAQTVQLLGGAVEAKDHETGEHVARVMVLADRIGRSLGWSEPLLRDLRFGAALHDVGKIGVPEAVLTKPGPLDDAELVLMRRHPLTGATIVAGVPALHAAALAVRHHHERWDGKGYPDGLAGEAIPPAARVVAIADVFDALRSDRPYRAGWPLERVVDFIGQGRGTAFEPQLVEVLLAMIHQETPAASAV